MLGRVFKREELLLRLVSKRVLVLYDVKSEVGSSGSDIPEGILAIELHFLELFSQGFKVLFGQLFFFSLKFC